LGRDERPGSAGKGLYSLTWLPLALFALVTWSVQRVVTKVALLRWSTARFYRWNAIVSVIVYLPFAIALPPATERLAGALGLSLLMALTFWVTTEAMRRGSVGTVAPLTATSPAITASLAVLFLSERPDTLGVVGIAAAIVAAILLACRPTRSVLGPWVGLAIASLLLQGVGAFLAKLVVSDASPTTLLVPSVLVQLAVGAAIARREPVGMRDALTGRPFVVTLTLAAAALATVGYLAALSTGPASVIVPLVATSPTVGGILGILVLRERVTRLQALGIAAGLVAIVLLARPS
jgi:drug/metabolite transporter (DMT)-like permease